MKEEKLPEEQDDPTKQEALEDPEDYMDIEGHEEPIDSDAADMPQPSERLVVKSLAAILAGGFLGGLCRISLYKALAWAPLAVAPTLFVNLTGAFALGFISEILAAKGPDKGNLRLVRLLGATGFMGGYTTYGTFVLECFGHLSKGNFGAGLGYALLSIVLGIGCGWAGIKLAQKLIAKKEVAR